MKGGEQMSITLKAARVNADLTLAEAAKELGIAVDTLRQYEAGNSFPNVPMIQKIEKLYSIGYNDINFFSNQKTV
jgi:transcriptional regulator with XRE-family HTH domain